MRHRFGQALHADLDTLARNRACHEHDLPVVTREHAPTGHGALDVERERVAGLHSKAMTGSENRSRISRSMDAVCARA
jgi:hypothetical protein